MAMSKVMPKAHRTDPRSACYWDRKWESMWAQTTALGLVKHWARPKVIWMVLMYESKKAYRKDCGLEKWMAKRFQLDGHSEHQKGTHSSMEPTRGQSLGYLTAAH